MCQSLSVSPADIAEEIAAMPHRIGLYLSIDELKRQFKFSFDTEIASPAALARINFMV